ncbi:ABC transporter substrate-binding protein [Pontibacillus chungwhensis BH030062]|uniref:ABC transporter substrate-binding protein n=1 Tax=Pontibacillus chungwhensis BH030062 TaxID=1385513 RepID=A0A0A2UTG4_9BACI|nr:transporter substrate-binding domain-containing protein [Pontibacillus chungwhensis]KGP91602.1 ABC transporter substrate-binding protein [Pontibacillus chungwhensis BH030062]
MKKFALILSIMATMVVLAACGSSEAANGEGEDGKKTLVMGTSADYKPFEFIDTANSDEIVGFDIDIAKHITEELGYELKIENMDFSGLIAALNSNKVDFVFAGMSPNEKREKQVDFSDIYYEAHNAVVSMEDTSIEELSDLQGKKIGVQLGSIQEGKAKELQEEYEGIEVIQRDLIPQLVEELKTGRIDAAIIEDSVTSGYLEKNEKLTQFILDPNTSKGSAAAFPDDSELVEEFNEEIEKMKESGKMDELIKKWFENGGKSE